MRLLFQRQLSSLGDDIQTMADLVVDSITGASKALTDVDIAAADAVIASDGRIDALERDLDERSVAMLAQQQPVATDLRVVVSALRMSATLERMGDLARHVAEVARLRYPERAYPDQVAGTFEAMAAAAVRSGRAVKEVLETRDVALAESLAADDDALDRLHVSVFEALASPSWAGSVRQTVDVTLLSRYLERFGDHAVSIGQRVVFLVTGELGADFDI